MSENLEVINTVTQRANEPIPKPSPRTLIEINEKEFNKLLTQDRKRSMNQKIEGIEQRIKHLKKIKRRWQLADNIIKILGITITFSFTLLTTIINVLPESSINSSTVKVLTAVFSSLAAITAIGSEGTILGFTGKNKSKFIKQIKQQETKLHKVFIYYEKARSDAVITNEELAEFFSLLNDTPESTFQLA